MAHKQVNKEEVLVEINGNISKVFVGEYNSRTPTQTRRSTVITNQAVTAVAQGTLTSNLMMNCKPVLTGIFIPDEPDAHLVPYSPAYIQSQIPKAKSIFEMSANEFKAHVRPRTIELTKNRWNKGLYLSTPAGNSYKANQFFHIYKDKSIKLVEVNAKTGEVNLIKEIP